MSGRTDLAARQAAFAEAVIAGAPPPPGFSVERVRAAAASLANKRRGSVARAWPGLAAGLGDELRPLFAAYASSVPHPLEGGPLADGLAFGDWLEARGRLPPGAEGQRLSVRLRHRRAPGGLRRRRGPWLAVGRIQGRWVAAVYIPPLGERWWWLPSSFSATP